MLKVAVVTVTYNSQNVLHDFLETLARQNGVELGIFVVDNASVDGTLVMVDAWRAMSCVARVDVIRNRENRGVAVANNQGITAALAWGADWVAIMNNDTYSNSSELFRQLVDAAAAVHCRVITPVIAATEPPDTNWYSGGVVHRWRGFQVKHTGMGESLTIPEGQPYRTSYAPTCCLLVEAGIFDEVGLMDEDFFVYGDDVDFSLRLAAALRSPYVAPKSLLIHKASSLTGGFLSEFTIRWLTRNWVLVMRKHGAPLERVVGTLYIQAWMFGRFITRREGFRQYLLRQRSFAEGWRQKLNTYEWESAPWAG